MKLLLHPKAREAFNSKAEVLLAKVIHRPVWQHGQTNQFSPDFHIQETFTSEHISDAVRFHRGRNNAVTARFYLHNFTETGLEADGYDELRAISEDLYNRKELNPYLSLESVETSLFNWLIERYFKITSLPYLEYALPGLENSITERLIVIPVFGLSTQGSFPCGKITIYPLNSDFFDQWKQGLSNHPKLDTSQMREVVQGFRKTLQGYAACITKTEAERKRAHEIAMEETENALSLIRLFTPASMSASNISFCRPFGKQSLEEELIFDLDITRNIPNAWMRRFVHQVDRLAIDAVVFEELDRAGLGVLHQLYNQKGKTDFQKDLITAILMYSAL